ncbi:MAG: hypothetical protein R2932_22585 [Caldilineaceae bacterium]
MWEDIADVCIGEQRTLINRLPEHQGNRLFFFCDSGAVRFTEIVVWAFWYRALLLPKGRRSPRKSAATVL